MTPTPSALQEPTKPAAKSALWLKRGLSALRWLLLLAVCLDTGYTWVQSARAYGQAQQHIQETQALLQQAQHATPQAPAVANTLNTLSARLIFWQQQTERYAPKQTLHTVLAGLQTALLLLVLLASIQWAIRTAVASPAPADSAGTHFQREVTQAACILSALAGLSTLLSLY